MDSTQTIEKRPQKGEKGEVEPRYEGGKVVETSPWRQTTRGGEKRWG